MNAYAKVCIVCAKPRAGGCFTCKRCGRGRYCGAECQKLHWKTTHKAVCFKLADLLSRPRQAAPPTRPDVSPPLPSPRERLSLPRVAAARAELAATAPAATAAFLAVAILNPDGGAAERAALADPTSAAAQELLCHYAGVGGATLGTSLPALLAAGVPPDAAFRWGLGRVRCALASAVCYAALAPNVDLLLTCGADPDGPSAPDVIPPLVLAVWRGNTSAVRRLLELGANPDGQCDFSVSPLMACTHLLSSCGPAAEASGAFPAEEGVDTSAAAVACASLLLAAGAKVDGSPRRLAIDPKTPLLEAVVLGEPALPLVELLLSAGADTETRDALGRTILVISALSRVPAPRVFSRLLAAGANPAPAPHVGGVVGPGELSLPYVYFLARSPGRLPLLQAALAAGADPGEFVTATVDLTGELCGVWTPLGLALHEAEGAGVRSLLEWGACPITPAELFVRRDVSCTWYRSRRNHQPPAESCIAPLPRSCAWSLGCGARPFGCRRRR